MNVAPWLQSDGFESAAILFFAFVIGHAVGDFALQTEFMARGKNRFRQVQPTEWPVGGLWIYCLSAHALIHAGIVWVICGRPAFALAEFALHWLIDLFKAERRVNFHADQGLHIACKLVYTAIIVAG